jgi:hypothetical protein
VSGLAVPDQQVEEIDGEKRVVDTPMVGAGGDVVCDFGPKSFQGGWISGVVVAVNCDLACPVYGIPKQRLHLLSNRPGVRPSVEGLELFTPGLLFGRHASLAPQLAVGEPEDEIGVFLHAQVEMKRIVLAELKRLDPVDNHRIGQPHVFDTLAVIEHAVSPQARELIVNRLG